MAGFTRFCRWQRPHNASLPAVAAIPEPQARGANQLEHAPTGVALAETPPAPLVRESALGQRPAACHLARRHPLLRHIVVHHDVYSVLPVLRLTSLSEPSPRRSTGPAWKATPQAPGTPRPSSAVSYPTSLRPGNQGPISGPPQGRILQQMYTFPHVGA